MQQKQIKKPTQNKGGKHQNNMSSRRPLAPKLEEGVSAAPGPSWKPTAMAAGEGRRPDPAQGNVATCALWGRQRAGCNGSDGRRMGWLMDPLQSAGVGGPPSAAFSQKKKLP